MNAEHLAAVIASEVGFGRWFTSTEIDRWGEYASCVATLRVRGRLDKRDLDVNDPRRRSSVRSEYRLVRADRIA